MSGAIRLPDTLSYVSRSAGAVSIGGTTINLDVSVAAAGLAAGWLVIDAYSANAEIRKVQSVSGVTVTLASSFSNNHAAGCALIQLQELIANVMWFGATGAGVADDTAACQAALTAAQSGGLGAKLYFPTGTYLISGTTGSRFAISSSYIEIFGDGIGKSIIQYAPSVALTGNVNVFDCTALNPIIHDLSITNGAGMSGASAWRAINLDVGCYHPHVYRVDISAAYGGGGAGGGGIILGQNWNTAESTTTLGTTIVAGTRTVTPPSMKGIYVGRRLPIGGTAEEVVVTAVTATTFTAAFANAHASTDSVTIRSDGRQYAVVEFCSIHDSFQATGMVINSSANTFYKNRIVNVGSSIQQHGFYAQGGDNVFDSNYVEGVSGYSFHGHKQVPNIDASGDRYVNNTSLNPAGGHMVIDSQTSDGTNPNVPNTIQLTRNVVIAGNLFKNTNGFPTAIGLTISVPASISANIFEDLNTSGSAWLNCAATSSAAIVGNHFRVVNSSVSYAMIATGANCTVEGNTLVAGAATGASLIRAGTLNNIIGNNLTLSDGTGMDSNTGCEVSGNVIIATSTAKCIGVAAGNIHNNYFSAAGSLMQLTNARICSLHDNVFGGAGYVRFDSGSKDLVLYNNEGQLSQVGNVALTQHRTSGHALYWPNAVASALTAGQLVTMDGSQLLKKTATTDTIFLGITGTSCATPADFYLMGQPNTEFDGVLCDGAWTAGHVGIVSTTVAGKIHDSGVSTPPASGSYVVFLDTGGGAGSARVLVMRTL